MRWVNFIMVLEQCSMHERQPYLTEWHLCLIPELLLSWYEIPVYYWTPRLITILTEGALYTWWFIWIKFTYSHSHSRIFIYNSALFMWDSLSTVIHTPFDYLLLRLYIFHPSHQKLLSASLYLKTSLSLWSFPVRQEFWTKFFSYPCSWSVSQSVALSALRNDIPCNSVQFWPQYSFWAQDHLHINRLLHI